MYLNLCAGWTTFPGFPEMIDGSRLRLYGSVGWYVGSVGWNEDSEIVCHNP